MDTMTISTKNFQVILISFPVYKAAAPSILSVFGGYFLGLVNMIYVQNTNVVITTLYALTAELCNECLLSVPYFLFAFFFALTISVVPIGYSAFIRTKSSASRFAAVGTLSRPSPPIFEIAIHRTIDRLFTGLLLVKSLTALFTYSRLASFWAVGWQSSLSFIPRYFINSSYYTIAIKYFDIAVKRISEAQLQIRMPI